MVLTGGWETRVMASPSSNGTGPRRAWPKARGVSRGASTTVPLLETSEPSRAPRANQGVEEGPGRVLELACGRSVIRHNLLQEATSVLSYLGVELPDVDKRLEAEGLCQVRKWHQLKVAINLGCL